MWSHFCDLRSTGQPNFAVNSFVWDVAQRSFPDLLATAHAFTGFPSRDFQSLLHAGLALSSGVSCHPMPHLPPEENN